MKLMICLASLLGLLITVGCEEEHEHHHGPYGGAYDGYNQGYGHGYWDANHVWHHDHD